ncbi:Putative integrase/resolvase recombinase protein [Neorhizobium galegae bv. orientalis]|nr:Putative integrase/resolvase recombinase protein [Neorhizobium galegae bv. orientalis]
MNVSRIVSLHVQSDVSPEAEIISAKKRNRKLKKRSSGLYLVRSGGIYLFQIRLPKRIGGGAGSRPIRVSLGALPHQEARELADALAALARTVFKEIEKRMAGYEGPDLSHIVSGLADEDIPADDWPFEFATLILKGGLFDLREPARAPTPEEAKGLEMMRGLVRIGREVSAKQSGQPHDEMIADNADMLVARHISKHDEAVASVNVHVPDRLYTTTQLQSPVSPERDMPPVVSPIAAHPEDGEKTARRRISADVTPAFMLDRRTVERPPSTKPLFSKVASDYLATRKASKSGVNKDIAIAESRLNLFVELIGDHPINTYTGTDLQAFIDLMKFWPKNPKHRLDHLTAREIIASNNPTVFETLARKTLEEGYVAVIKSALNSGQTDYDYSPIAGAKLKYPDSARAPVNTEPLGYAKIQKLFETGVASGLFDNAMLPLLGFMTGRRLGLLLHLKGHDFREKFEGVWVAQTSGIVQNNGVWQRVPIKTDASASFFVLHNFLAEIGFVQWAKATGDQFLFRELIRLADPSKSASSYMARLFEGAGIKEARGEVFHSLRSGYISESGDQNIEKRDRQLQVGHEIGDDEHDKYGFRSLTEKKARMLANLPLNPEIDLSMFQGLDFDKLSAAKRTLGRKPGASLV